MVERLTHKGRRLAALNVENSSMDFLADLMRKEAMVYVVSFVLCACSFWVDHCFTVCVPQTTG
jgi:hypothetical protein